MYIWRCSYGGPFKMIYLYKCTFLVIRYSFINVLIYYFLRCLKNVIPTPGNFGFYLDVWLRVYYVLRFFIRRLLTLFLNCFIHIGSDLVLGTDTVMHIISCTCTSAEFADPWFAHWPNRTTLDTSTSCLQVTRLSRLPADRCHFHPNCFREVRPEHQFNMEHKSDCRRFFVFSVCVIFCNSHDFIVQV